MHLKRRFLKRSWFKTFGLCVVFYIEYSSKTHEDEETMNITFSREKFFK